MTTWVRVETSTHDVLGDHGMYYRQIVEWSERQDFPMLAHIDPMGVTYFNEHQAFTLDEELARIQELISDLGPEATLRRTSPSSPRLGSLDIPNWDAQRDLAPLVVELRALCTVVQQKPHRLLAFLGD